MRNAAFLFVALALVFCPSCKNKGKKEKKVEVATVVVKRETVPVPLRFVGVAQSSHLVEIWSRVPGYLDKIAYEEGSFVKEGDVLFEIDPREFESAVSEAKANLDREKAGLWAAQKAVERYKPLYAQKAASRKDLDDATAQLLAEQAAVEMFQAKLEEAELNLSYATIRSPISGQTSSSKFREGTLIQPGVNGLLTTVYVLDPMWINIAVSDSYFLASQQEIARGELKVPDNFEFEVWLTMADGSEYPFPGTVSFISPVLDPNTGSLSVRGIFPNPDNILKPGQFVRVRAVGAERPNAIVVPQEAVQQGAKGRFVYVVDNDRRAQVRYVDTGSWYETGWIIKSGLKAGDEVIVSGVEKVRDGTRVKPRAGS